jgi:DeoR/GlpR family transcriptional regulator of sugar metabolism
MSKNTRQDEILEILKSEGFVGVRELGERLYASQPTVRRDLDQLEKSGLVRRSHGGAMLAGDSTHTPVSYRRGKSLKEKMRIARLAAQLIENDQLIFTDASSTALCLSEHIKETANISVVTNGILMCQALAKQNIRVFSTGGRLVGESLAFAGSVAEKTASGFFADLMFFSAASVDEDGMISDFAEEETALRSTMFAHSKKSVFMCDSSKLGCRSPFCLFPLSSVDYVVTDMPLPQDLIAAHGFDLLKTEGGAYMYGRR